jgi:acetylglutamate/LysW-gamma-L-alpha-aminoadipate kinase
MEQNVDGRMKRKILALRKLFADSDSSNETNNTTVILSDGRTEHPIQDALNGKGTTIQ